MTRTNRTGKQASGAGRFSYEGLDRVIHEKARLGILASLAAHQDGLAFNDLKELCSLTDGNLSRHLAVLTDAGLVKTFRSGRGPRAQTTYSLTASGRKRFVEYINVLESVVSDAHQDEKAHRRASARSTTKLSPS